MEQRPWGCFEVITSEPQYKLKKITVKGHQKLSLQSHQFRSEHWVCLSGRGSAQINERLVPLEANSYIFIAFGDKHRLINQGDQPLVIIEAQTGTYFGEDDIVRYEDDYGRDVAV